MNNKFTGTKGEVYAREYLLQKGYTIVNCNQIIAGSEIDIIAKREDIIVFCEVKARENTSFGRGIEAIDKAKIKRYIRAGLIYMAKKENNNKSLRFDVIEINGGNINHVEDAFRP